MCMLSFRILIAIALVCGSLFAGSNKNGYGVTEIDTALIRSSFPQLKMLAYGAGVVLYDP